MEKLSKANACETFSLQDNSANPRL